MLRFFDFLRPPRLLPAALFAVCMLSAPAVYCQPALYCDQAVRLLSIDNTGFDNFGSSVDVDGDFAVVGARAHATAAGMTGAAHIFVRSGGSWVEDAKLTPSDGVAGDLFGQSVAISGDTAVVGAFWHATNGFLAGAAYVYVRDPVGGGWTEEQKLLPPTVGPGDQFGWDVAIDGDTIAVAANADGTGSVHIFDRSVMVWTEQVVLTPMDGAVLDGFGSGVAFEGETLIVGSPDHAHAGVAEGGAYVFVRSPGGVWAEEAELIASDTALDDGFGWGVAVSGDLIVVGASYHDAGGMNAGAAYLFRGAGATWTEEAKLQASTPRPSDFFGRGVDVEGGRVVVGAPTNDLSDPFGFVYYFVGSGGVWSEEDSFQAAGGTFMDWFGGSVALDRGTVVVGAHLRDDLGPNSGAAFVFECLDDPDEDPFPSDAFVNVTTTPAEDDTFKDGIESEASLLLPQALHAGQSSLRDSHRQRDHPRHDHPRDRYKHRNRGIRLSNITDDPATMNWVRIEVEDEGPTDATYDFAVRSLTTGRRIHAPGTSSDRTAHVLLSPGTYFVQVTSQAPDAGGQQTGSDEIVVPGEAIEGTRGSRVEWGLGEDWQPGDSTLTVYHPAGPAAWSELYDHIGLGAAEGPIETPTSCIPDDGPSAWGVTGAVTASLSFTPTVGMALGRHKGRGDFDQGTRYVKGALFMSSALALTNTISASVQASGGEGSSCFADTLAAINAQFAFQQGEIDRIFDIIDRDEDVFFQQMTKVNTLATNDATLAYHDTRESLADQFVLFQERAGMWSDDQTPWEDPSNPGVSIDIILGPTWQPMTPNVWADADGDGVGDNIDPSDPSYQTYSLADCPYEDAACCFDQLRSSACVETGTGPVNRVQSMDFESLRTQLKDLSGSEYQDPGGSNKYDAYKNISSHDGDAFVLSQYDQLLQHYTLKLCNGYQVCVAQDTTARSWCPNLSTTGYPNDPADDPQGGCADENTGCEDSGVTPDDNNVVPLFETYNESVVALTMQAAFALDQAFRMEWLINQYNYESFIARGEYIPAPTTLPGTHYNPTQAILCDFGDQLTQDDHWERTGAYADGAEEQKTAYNCAQQQLALAYAKRVNLLYTHALNYTMTDRAVEGQGYPSTTFHGAAADFGLPADLSDSVDYDAELGSALTDCVSGLRSPTRWLSEQTGAQTGESAGETWTDRGVLYQAGIQDIGTCRKNLRAWLEAGNSTDITDFLSADPANCPSIFRLHDHQAIIGGFYDGQSLLPYSSEASPGGGESCPAACSTCDSGAVPDDDDPAFDTWPAGGEGLFASRNVAPLGEASQSTTDYGGVASLAIDGNTSGNFGDGSITHTQTVDPAPSWSLVLNEPTVIDSIRIWNRTDCCSERLSNFNVRLEDPLGATLFTTDYYTDGYPERSLEIVLPEGLDQPVASLHISLLGANPGTRYLSLAEVEVFTREAGAGDTELCRSFCSADNTCGDFRYAIDDEGDWIPGATDCRHCDGGPLLALGAPAPLNVSKCSETGTWEPTWCANEGEDCACEGDATVYYGKRWLNSQTDNIAPGSGTQMDFRQMTSPVDYLDYTGNTFTTALADAQPPNFTTGTATDGVISCSNSGFTDPAYSFEKQCYCAPRRGNQLTWYTTPDDASFDANTKAGIAPNLPVLSCGNWEGLQTIDANGAATDPGVGLGTYYESNYSGSDKPPPGAITENGEALYEAVYYTMSTSCKEFSDANGYSYVTMTDPRCARSYELNTNSNDNDEVLVRGKFGTITCDRTSPQNTSHESDGKRCFSREDLPWTDASGGTLSDYTDDRPSFWGCNSVQFDQIKDTEDELYALTRFQIDPGNAATDAADGGPIIPLEIVLQCSDGDQAECPGGSDACVHLVATSNADTAREDGYTCTANQSEGRLDCVLRDGRELRVSLEDNNEDRWYKLAISKQTDEGWVSRCAESDFDFCPCEGEVFYGKKHLNSLGTGNTYIGDGEIARFEEMMDDVDTTLPWPNVQSPGLWCAPESFLDEDPAPGIYKQCFCRWSD